MEIDFENLFNEENVEKVNEEMQEYLPELFAQAKSIKNMNKIMKIFDKVFSLKNRQMMDLFIQYSNLKYEENLYENWLAYYIGFQKGSEKK